jgi:ATP-binding cassette subfamily B protein
MNPLLSWRHGAKVLDWWRTIALVREASGNRIIVLAALLVVQGLLPVAVVHLTRVLVDGVAQAMGGGASWQNVGGVVVAASLMAATLLLTELLQLVSEWLRISQAERVQDHIARLIHEKSASLDMRFFENPEFHDQLHRARGDAAGRALSLLDSTGSLLQNGITLVAMAAVLIPYGAWLPPALLLSTLPAFYVVLRASRRYHSWWNETTPDRRRIQYFDVILTDALYAGEVRLFDLGGHFRTLYQRLRARLYGERLKLLKEQMRSKLGASLLALLVTAAAMAWMLYRAFIGAVSLGDLALFYQAFQRGQSLARTLLASLGQIYTNSLYIGDLFRFLGLVPTIAEPADPVRAPAALAKGIRFRDVSFRYPGSPSLSLEGFNLEVAAGQLVALVGENGAGKTTVLKLVARFYDPENGTVELDGVDIRNISLASLRQNITFMFQLPVNYQLTVRENIALGHLPSLADGQRVEAAAEDAGADAVIRRMPRGYESQLGKWFPGGTELSGGEWQRIALARAFVRQAPIMLLDEPTSFMDSWAESDWFRRLRELARNRTVILVTHRLTTAALADMIHVMREGRIVESGTHQQLMGQGGLYHQSWSAHVTGRRQ